MDDIVDKEEENTVPEQNEPEIEKNEEDKHNEVEQDGEQQPDNPPVDAPVEDIPKEDNQAEDIQNDEKPPEENPVEEQPLEEPPQDDKPTETDFVVLDNEAEKDKIQIEDQENGKTDEGEVKEPADDTEKVEEGKLDDVETDKVVGVENKNLEDEGKEMIKGDTKEKDKDDDSIIDQTETLDLGSVTPTRISLEESKLKHFEMDRGSMPHPISFTRANSSCERESGVRSCDDSFYVQENPEGQDLLNELFSEKHARLKVDDESYISFSDKEIIAESTGSRETVFHRFDIIDKIRAANEQRKTMLTENQFLQSRLIEYFRMVKVKQTVGTKLSSDKESLMDFNTQYLRYAEILYGLMKELEGQQAKFDEKIEKLKIASEVKIEQLNSTTNEFSKYEETVGLASLHSRMGNHLEASVINDYLQFELKKELIIKDVRLNNLKLEHKNAALDRALRSKENFEGGLRLIDFEQLKIENQTFNEKVEDREEGINKLNRKINRCNHLLSHIKEKIDVTDKDKKSSRIKAKLLDKEFKKVQKNNNKAKKVRDGIKLNNKHLQMSCGLLGKKDYLRCYEDANDDTENLRLRVANMESQKGNMAMKTSKLINEINKYKYNP